MGVLDWILGRPSAASGGEESGLVTPAGWLVDALGGRRTASGQRVSAEGAVAVDTYYACLRNIAEDLPKALPRVVRRLPDGAREPVDLAPEGDVLERRWNPHLSAKVGVQLLTAWRLGWGNGYAEIQRDGNLRAIALWPVHPSRVTVVVVPNATGEEVLYRVDGDGRSPTVVVPARDFLHVHGVGPDQYTGYSIAALAREDLGVALARKEFSGAFYANRAQVGGVLEYPRKLTPDQIEVLRAQWAKDHGGENAWRPAVLESGMKWTQTAVNPKDAQWIEGEEHGVVTVCRWFRMPPHKVQHLARATFSNIEHQGTEYVTDCLLSHAQEWEDEIEEKVLRPVDRSLRLKFDFRALMRGDSTTRSAYYRALAGIGVMTANEIRALEDLPRVEDPGADRLMVQGAMTSLSAAAEAPAPRANAPARPAPAPGGAGASALPPKASAWDPEAERAFTPVALGPGGAPDVSVPAAGAPGGGVRAAIEVPLVLLASWAREVLERARARETLAFRRARARHDDDLHAFGAWAREWLPRQREWVLEALRPALRAFEAHAAPLLDEGGVAPALEAAADRWCDALALELLAAYKEGRDLDGGSPARQAQALVDGLAAGRKEGP